LTESVDYAKTNHRNGDKQLTTILILAAAALIFATVAFFKARAELAAHAAEQASKHIPNPTIYTGPRFTAHGREIQQTGRRII
jgi:hypothetical protein